VFPNVPVTLCNKASIFLSNDVTLHRARFHYLAYLLRAPKEGSKCIRFWENCGRFNNLLRTHSVLMTINCLATVHRVSHGISVNGLHTETE